MAQEQQGAVVFGQVDDELLYRHSLGQNLLGSGNDLGAASVGHHIDHFADRVDSNQAQLFLDLFEGDLLVGKGGDLIEQGVGIAQGAGSLFSNPEQRFIFGLKAHVGNHLLQLRLDMLEGNEAEVKLLTARADGGRNLVDFGSGKDKHDIWGRLFDRLQQGVEGAVAEHVDFVDDVYFIPAAVGGEEYLVF